VMGNPGLKEPRRYGGEYGYLYNFKLPCEDHYVTFRSRLTPDEMVVHCQSSDREVDLTETDQYMCNDYIRINWVEGSKFEDNWAIIKIGELPLW